MRHDYWRNYGIACIVLVVSAVGGRAVGGMLSGYWENDSRALKPNGAADRHYTNGSKLVYVFEPNWQWLSDFGDWGLPAGDSAKTAAGFFLGQNMYTPNHVRNPERRGEHERVFAGWLYTGMFVQRRQGASLDHVELSVGVVGPASRAHRAQHCIHQVLGSGKPVGWDEQIGDEPAADFTWVRKHRHNGGLMAQNDFIDLVSDVGFTAGSLHRRVEAGLMLRCGLTKLPDDFGPGRYLLPKSQAGMDIDAARWAYLFARLSGRAVEHDRFLSGLTHRPLTGRAEIGVACRYGDFEVAYSQTFLTHEFKEQGVTDSFGSLTISWLF